MSNDKPWYTSKTIWFNVLTTGLAVLGALAGSAFIANNPKLTAAFGAAIAVLNVVLRTVTTQPVTK